jgi:hypothetical protein
MSSLAFDDDQVQMHSCSAVMDFEPELCVVKPRQLFRNHGFPSAAHLEEIVQIGGIFTISF